MLVTAGSWKFETPSRANTLYLLVRRALTPSKSWSYTDGEAVSGSQKLSGGLRN